MGHTKPADLKDLANEIAEIRSFDGLKEKSPNVFYYKAIPFLHFHDKDGVRWADVKKTNGAWQRLDVDFKANAASRAKFLKAARMAHAAITKPKKIRST